MERQTILFCILLWAAYFSAPGLLIAQESVTELEEVEITDTRISQFAVGASTTKFDSTMMSFAPAVSLADLLKDYTTAHIKAYGHGMLSSISFRGTGPEHTAVLWNGVNISYAMLGQTDFSLLPPALNDQLLVQHGTGSSLYGSGALGGTVALSSSRPSLGVNFEMGQWFGSFGTMRNNASLSFAKKRYFVRLRSSWTKSDNNFAYRNSTKIGSPTELQQNAAFDQLGFDMESGVKLGKASELLISAQYLDMDRQLQPSMNIAVADDFQNDNNLRLRTRYSINGSQAKWYIQYAYLADQIDYNGGVTKSQQHVIRTSAEQQFGNKIKASLAADHSFVDVRAEFYRNEAVSETRTNIWGSVLILPGPWLTLSVNMRQGFHPVFTVPFSPSLGAEISLRETASGKQQISFMAARGFRIPTINELYWNPGGNLNLVPEESYSAEIGYHGEFGRRDVFSYQLTGYRMWVENWILWRPEGNIWSPENIRQVDVYGVEFSTSFDHEIGRATLSWQGNYAFTRSLNRTGLDQFDRSVNKQLRYTPVHKGGVTTSLHLNRWTVMVNGVAIGRRFTTSDNENYLPAYFLLNLNASKNITLGKYGLSIYASVNNLLNVSYQSVENRAMPGINYIAGLKFNFTNPNL